MAHKKRTGSRKHQKEDSVPYEGSSGEAGEDEIMASLQRICSEIQESNNLLHSLTTELLKAINDAVAEVSAIQKHLVEGEQHVKSLFDAFSSIIGKGSAQEADQDINEVQPRGVATMPEKPSDQGNRNSADSSPRRKGKRKAEDDEGNENSGRGKKKRRQDLLSPSGSGRTNPSISQQGDIFHEPVRPIGNQNTIDIFTSDGDESDDSYYPSSSGESDSTTFSDVSSSSSVLSDYSSSDSDGDQPTHPGSYFPSIKMPSRPLPDPRSKSLRRDYETLFDLGGGSVVVFRDRIAESWWSAAPYQRHTSREEDFELITEGSNAPFEFSLGRP